MNNDPNDLINLLLRRRFDGQTDEQIMAGAASALRHLLSELEYQKGYNSAAVAERDRLTLAIKSLMKQSDVQLRALDVLNIECVSLRTDAERYRWLRHWDNDEQVIRRCGVMLRGEMLDAAIDAALASKKSQHSVTDSIDSPQAPLT